METEKLAKWIIFSFVSIALILLALVVGYYMGANSGNQGYAKGWAGAKAQIDKTGLFPEDNQPAFTVSGRVESVIGSTITIESEQIPASPLSPQTPTERTIIINSDTTIIRRVPKPAAKYQQEQTAYLKSIQDLKPNQFPPEMPLPYTEQKITINDLKINNHISITARKNIRYEKSIPAEKIVKLDI